MGSLFQCFLASFRGASLNNNNRQNILIETHPFAPPPDPLIFPRYRHRANGDFVNKEIPEEVNRILGSRKWSTVTGKESFIDWVKSTFFLQKRHVEVPESKTLTPSFHNWPWPGCCTRGKIFFLFRANGLRFIQLVSYGHPYF